MRKRSCYIISVLILFAPFLARAESIKAPPVLIALTTKPVAEDACGRFNSRGLVCLKLTPEQEKVIDTTGNLDTISYAMNCRGYSFPGATRSAADLFLQRSVCGIALLGEGQFSDGVTVPTLRFVVAHTPAQNQPPALSLFTEDDGTLASSFGPGIPLDGIYTDEARAYVANLESAKKAELEAKQHSAQLAEESRQQAINYGNTPEARRKIAAGGIKACSQQIKAAKYALDQDRRVAAISGVSNLATRHEAGQEIVGCEDQIAVQWREYKAAGGSAASISDLE